MISAIQPNGKFTIEVYENEAQWLRARRNSLGASEISALLNLNAFCGRFGLYMRKTELPDGGDDDGGNLGEMRDAGHLHEPTLRRWFEKQTGFPVTDPGPYTICRSVDRPHMTCTLDGWIEAERRPVEIKCAWYAAGKVWAQRIPIGYQVQAQQQLYITDADVCYFAALVDGYKFRWYRINRHDKIIARLCREADAFWERIQRRDPPDIEGDSTALKNIFKLYPEDDGQTVDLSDEAEQWTSELDRLKDEIREREANAAYYAGKIQLEMQEAAYGRLGDGSGFRWKKTASGTRPFVRVEHVRENRWQVQPNS